MFKPKLMRTDELKNYIGKKITEIEEHRDVTEYTKRGRFNFGIVQQQYGHLPSWALFVQGKKKLVRLIWIQAFFSALMAFAFADNWDHEWWKIIIKMLIGALLFTLFFNIHAYFFIAFEVNRVQKKVQRLLYEDLLHQLEQNEKTEVASK